MLMLAVLLHVQLFNNKILNLSICNAGAEKQNVNVVNLYQHIKYQKTKQKIYEISANTYSAQYKC